MTTAETILCPHADCRHGNLSDARFCARCGRQLPDVPDNSARAGPPSTMWVGLIALGFMTLIHLVMGIGVRPAFLLAAVIDALLWFGLYRGHRWAYVVTILCVAANLVATLARGGVVAALLALAVNGMVLVPMLLCTDYFWQKRDTEAA